MNEFCDYESDYIINIDRWKNAYQLIVKDFQNPIAEITEKPEMTDVQIRCPR